MSSLRLVVSVLLCLLVVPHPAAAAVVPGRSGAEKECPDGNVLSGAKAVDPAIPSDRLGLLFDGVIAPDGAPWPDPSILFTIHRPLTLELAHPAEVTQLLLQIDADQAFEVGLSTDGVAWTRISAAALDVASGMQLRAFDLPRSETRYVRLAARDASGSLALSELRLHCKRQPVPTTGFVVRGRHPPAGAPGIVERAAGKVLGAPVSPTSVNVVKLAVVAMTLAWMALGSILRRALKGGARVLQRTEHLFLGCLATVAVLAYFDLGAYRYPAFIHGHDVFHYFVGAKYFPEIGYDDLYRCAAVAEAEAGFSQRVTLRSQRDLRNNELVSGADVLSHGAECKQHFSPERWTDFVRDVAYFADAHAVPEWHRILRDHGFNASPTWIALGAAVARALPANDATVGFEPALLHGAVGPLDPLLLAVALGAVLWAFGFRTASVVAIVFGTNPLSEFSWIGGSFLREAWLAALVVGICCLKRRHFRLGGVGVALSALFQLFPAACLFAVALAGVLERWSTGKANRDALRALGAAAITITLAVPLSAWASGRAGAWTEFAANTRKHAETPAGNYVGLPTALSFRPSTRVAVLFDENAVDPFARAQAARIRNFAEVRPIYLLSVALAAWGVVRACRSRRAEWWASLGGLVFTAFALETSCYYAAWLAVVALAGAEQRTAEIPILVTLLGLLAVEFLGLQIDVHYALASVLLVLGMAGVLAVLGAREPREVQA